MLEKHSVYVAVDALVHDCAERASRFFTRFLKREEIYVFVVCHADSIAQFSALCNICVSCIAQMTDLR